jgi:primosomal protein N'
MECDGCHPGVVTHRLYGPRAPFRRLRGSSKKRAADHRPQTACERLIIALRRLADRAISSSSTLCIQANYALLTEAKTWLTAEGLRDAYAKEFAERTAFKLPPSYRLAKIIFRGNEPAIRIIFERLLNEASLIGGITVQGLYPVDHRGAREPRWIAHIAAPAEMPDAAFLSALAPAVASDALIDLDPVAFFE